MRLRDTRVYCAFGSNGNAEPVVLRESCWREATIQSLSAVSLLLFHTTVSVLEILPDLVLRYVML